MLLRRQMIRIHNEQSCESFANLTSVMTELLTMIRECTHALCFVYTETIVMVFAFLIIHMHYKASLVAV